MANGLEDIWAKFSLTKKVQADVLVDQERVEETITEGRNCLIGRVLT